MAFKEYGQGVHATKYGKGQKAIKKKTQRKDLVPPTFISNGYVERYEKAKGRYDELSAECEAKKAKGRAIERFLTDFAERDEPITEFDDCLWLTAIDRVTVRNDGVLVFRFNYGGEIEG